jgi:hypothetical protein
MKSRRSKRISSGTAYITEGESISTVGIDEDFLSGFNIAGADEYLLALKMLIVLFVILIAVWKMQLLSTARY